MARVGSSIGNPDWFMGDQIRNGASARQAVIAFRKAGGAMADRAFREQYALVRQSLLDHPTVASLPYNRVPGGEHFAAWRTNTPGAYAYQMQVREWVPSIGSHITHEWTVTSDVPIAPGNALQQGMADVQEGADANPDYGGGRVTGATLTGLYKMI